MQRCRDQHRLRMMEKPFHAGYVRSPADDSVSDEGPTTENLHNEFSPARVRDLYRSFPDELKHQIKVLAPEFSKDSRVLETYRTIMGSFPYQGHVDVEIWGYAMVSAIPVLEIVQKTRFNILRCYNERGHLIKLENEITSGKHVRLYSATHLRTGRQVIVKLYQSSSGRDTSYENGIYRRLGKPEPCFSTAYFLWGCPVLVMAPLRPLDTKDDEYEMGIQVIQQLRYLHRFGVHCDIKPGNVMKRLRYNGKKRYLVIDYGGVSVETKAHGYRRWVWSPKWTSQPRRSENEGRDVIATAKNDLIELGYTMKTLQNDKQGISNRKEGQTDPIRSGFTGRLKQYMDYVSRIDDTASGPGVTDADREMCCRILAGEFVRATR